MQRRRYYIRGAYPNDPGIRETGLAASARHGGHDVQRLARRGRGAIAVYGPASHGVFEAKATEVLSNPALEKIVVTNTIPPFRLASELAHRKLTVLDASQLFAEAIRRSHSGGSIVDLLDT